MHRSHVAVLAVRREPLSVPVNPLIHGKVEGILQNSTGRRRSNGRKPTISTPIP
jgi:hypothetical protein